MANGQASHCSRAARVIVSAGAFGSPQLLLLSSINPGEHLGKMGVPVQRRLAPASAATSRTTSTTCRRGAAAPTARPLRRLAARQRQLGSAR
ncbi:MAG: GMC family oxidoreductase N-terminal domain-containing protein [Rubrivivax sp.]